MAMKPRHKKLALIALVVAALGVAVALVLNAFNSNLVFFFTPTQIANGRRRPAVPFALAAWSRRAASNGRRMV